jgi:hypothetical protein
MEVEVKEEALDRHADEIVAEGAVVAPLAVAAAPASAGTLLDTAAAPALPKRAPMCRRGVPRARARRSRWWAASASDPRQGISSMT